MSRFRSWWQKSRLRSWWLPIRKHRVVTIIISWWLPIRKHWVVTIIIIALIAVGMTIFLGYWPKWDTGFNEHIGPNVQQYQPAKTLWDWLQLLIVPIILAIGGYLFNRALSKNQQAATDNNQWESALQAYLDKMSKLLLDNNNPLRNSKSEDEVRTVARALTLTVLEQVGGKRRRSVLQFLYEARLICKDPCIIDLNGANLKDTNLRDINLKGVNLKGAYLYGADLAGDDTDLSDACLRSAKLKGANLKGANLFLTDLSGADLSGADLSGADLSGAKLSGAKLKGADLSVADLTGAIVTEKQLNRAKSLKGATMLKGAIHP